MSIKFSIGLLILTALTTMACASGSNGEATGDQNGAFTEMSPADGSAKHVGRVRLTSDAAASKQWSFVGTCAGNAVAALNIKVPADSPGAVRLERFIVQYGNGERQEIPFREVFLPTQPSRDVVLANGTRRCVNWVMAEGVPDGSSQDADMDIFTK